jgi:hypothetical protein
MQRVVELLEDREAGYGRFAPVMTSRKTPEEICLNILGIIQANP